MSVIYPLLLQIPVFLLLAAKGAKQFLISACVFIIFSAIVSIVSRKKQFKAENGIVYPFSAGMISLLLAAVFVVRWGAAQKMVSLGEVFKLSGMQTCFLTAFLLALLSLPGIDYIIQLIHSFFPSRYSINHRQDDSVYTIFYIVMTAFIVMLLNSRSSPLYAINDWVDPNTMFTVGKGVLKGYVPYRDLYEQKGPLLLFIHTFGAFLSYKSFFGIWIAELAACFVTLLLIYRILSLHYGKNSYILVPLPAVLIYGTQFFSPGDTAEEYCLPLLCWAFYTGIKLIHDEKFLSKKEFLITGIISGCVFWIKYSLTGFFIGWFIFFLIQAIYKHKVPDLLKGLGLILLGIFLITIPIFFYFVFHSALESLFEAYFFNNIFYYMEKNSSIFEKIWTGISFYVRGIPIQVFFILIGNAWLIFRKRWGLLSYNLLTSFFTVFFIYYGGNTHGYSAIPLSLFTIAGFLCILDACSKNSRIHTIIYEHEKVISIYGLILGAIFICVLSQNIRYMDHKKEDWFQYKMKEVIDRSGIENPSILYYHMGDAGINTVTGAIPGLRYFCYYRNPNLFDIEKVQQDCINSRCADYIITYSQNEMYYEKFETYEHAGYFMGVAEEGYPCYHYYTPAPE